jgi:tetratricopeptide (TPR) repeat protein
MNFYSNMPLHRLQEELARLRALSPSPELVHALIAYCWHLPDMDNVLLDHITEAQIVSETLDYPLGLAYCNLLNIQSHIASLESDSVKGLFQASVMQSALEDPTFRGFYLVVEAGFHIIHLNTGLALVNLLEAVFLFEREQNRLGLLGAYDLLGWCYGTFKDLESEIAYRKQAYALARQLESDAITLVIINNFIDALAEFGKIEEALPYLEEGAEILPRYNEENAGPMIPILQIRFLTFRAALLIHQRRLNEAQRLLDEARAIPLPPPIPPNINMMRCEVNSDFAIQYGDTKKAIEEATAGLAFAEQFDSSYYEKVFLQKLVELHRRQKDFERALNYSERLGVLDRGVLTRTEISRLQTIQQVRAYHELTEASQQMRIGMQALESLAQKLEAQHLNTLRLPSA